MIKMKTRAEEEMFVVEFRKKRKMNDKFEKRENRTTCSGDPEGIRGPGFVPLRGSYLLWLCVDWTIWFSPLSAPKNQTESRNKVSLKRKSATTKNKTGPGIHRNPCSSQMPGSGERAVKLNRV